MRLPRKLYRSLGLGARVDAGGQGGTLPELDEVSGEGYDALELNGSLVPRRSLKRSSSSGHSRGDVERLPSPGGDDAGLPVSAAPPRDQWDSKVEFLLAVIGFAVDLGNVWRFPYICYRNGGGAFLIPYLIMFIFGGLPLFYMELVLGQFHKAGCISIWKNICPLFKGIGFAICFICSYIAIFYNTIIAWAVYFLIRSFAAEVPWKHCGNPWNTPFCVETGVNISSLNNTSLFNHSTSPAEEFFLREVLEVHKAQGFEHMGSIKWSLALCLACVFVVVYFALWKGPSSSGKAVWITATLPYVVLLILVWIDAATQIFFSLGPGFGVLLALSSYNDFNNNCYKDALVTSVVNCMTSFISGFVIFSTLGYMSLILGKPVDEVAGEGGPGLIFVVYPQAIATMAGSSFWAILFFFMLITLGIDSTFGGLEAFITGVMDEYPQLIGRRRELFVLGLVIYCYLGALPTTTNGGQYLVEFLDHYGVAFSILFIVLVETVAVCWFYGVRRFSNDVETMLGFRPGMFWRVAWAVICPIFIFTIFIVACIELKPLSFEGYTYPTWSVVVGWTLRLSSILCIPGYAIYKLSRYSGVAVQRFAQAIRPENEDAQGRRIGASPDEADAILHSAKRAVAPPPPQPFDAL